MADDEVIAEPLGRRSCPRPALLALFRPVVEAQTRAVGPDAAGGRLRCALAGQGIIAEALLHYDLGKPHNLAARECLNCLVG